jgi:hypothetical protein
LCKNNDDSDDNNNNNNNNNSKSKKLCPYRETDPKGKKEYLKGKTLLEKHKNLLDYETQLIPKLEAQVKKLAEREDKRLQINMNDNLHIVQLIVHPTSVQHHVSSFLLLILKKLLSKLLQPMENFQKHLIPINPMVNGIK